MRDRFSISMMHRMKRLLTLLLLAFASCSSQQIPPQTRWEEIAGRHSSIPLYRINVPKNWQRVAIPGDLQDTTVAIAEFSIDNHVRITLHNFPVATADERIPPNAQIARWKRQFESLTAASVQITPQAFGGYAGLLFEGTGLIKGEPTTMMAWTMQLAPELYRQPLNSDMRSDYTIKVQGDPQSIEKEKKAITAFARSFELIHPIRIPS